MKQNVVFIVMMFFYITGCLPVQRAPTSTAQSKLTSFPPATQTSASTSVPMVTTIPTPLNPQIGSIMVSEKDGMLLVYVPAGEFSMGNDSGWDEEKPVHTVELDAFWIDQTEITNEMYAKCVQDGVCTEPSNVTRFNDGKYADHPVVYVSWNDAHVYCAWTGRRLPIEAEWEKAARGTDGRVFPWGNKIDCSFANYWGRENGCVDDTTPAGYYPEGISPYGALDMAGNVLEWVNSLFKPYPYGATDDREALDVSGARVLRGGSWNVTSEFVRSPRRDWYFPSVRRNYVGFRCAMSAIP